MAPNKFEQHIKEELNKREIKPSTSAWDKISSELDEPQEHKKSKYVWWGIAASFAGFLIISTIYYNVENSSIEKNNTVVDTDKDKTEIKNDKINKPLENTEETQIVNTTIKRNKIKVLEKSVDSKPNNPKDYQHKNEITEIAIVKPQLDIVTKKDVGKEKLIEQKIAEVIAKVENLEQNNKMVTDLEVDSLILQAQQEILQNKIFRQDQSVDAMALLNQVEDELDKPLKDQLFDLLKKGIFETRNAIADRN